MAMEHRGGTARPGRLRARFKTEQMHHPAQLTGN
jgi:hypothetical protein